MTRSPIRVRVPGKLLLLGEYGVLDPGAEALVLAVDRFVQVRIGSAARLTIDCPDLGLEALGGDIEDWRLCWDGAARETVSRRLSFVDRALALVLAMARARRLEVTPFRLRIESELGSGRDKAGLGSSASVTTGVAAAAMAWSGLEVEPATAPSALFQVASLAHYLAQGRKGSGADVAAAVAGGIVAYRNPGFEKELGTDAGCDPDMNEAARAASRPWPSLRLTEAPWPEGHQFVVGATGEAASTTGLIDRLAALHGEAATSYGALRAKLSRIAREAIEEPSPVAWADAMVAHQRALEEFDSSLGGLGIVTPAIERLVGLARQLGVPAKISGAGGGDSVIALAPLDRVPMIEDEWRAAGATTFVIARPVPGATIAHT